MLTLNVTIRTELGKKSKKLRTEALLPSILYGRKIKSIPLSVGYKEFEKIYREAGENTLILLNLENENKEFPRGNAVLIRDAVRHPLSGLFIHTDFYQVPMDEKIKVTVPINFVGEAPAVKNENAVFVRNIFAFEVSALPKDLPREIVVDLSALTHIGDSLTLKDIVFPQGVEVHLKPDFVIAAVGAPVQEEVTEEAASETVAPGAAEIKTEAEVKREEKAAKKAEEEAAKA